MSVRVANRGDVFWINPNPTSGRELKDRHRYIVITTKAINQYGIATTVPVTSGGNFSRTAKLAVPISGYDTSGVALCNQLRSFDINARVKNGSARYVETLDATLMDDIIDRVISVIDPAG